MSNLRVFEFAKQIGVETLNLMDKLREWEIPVKNHMATLDEETIQLIKERFQTEKAAKEPVKKVKKKVAEKTTATTKKTVSKAVAKKASTSAAVAATSKKTTGSKTTGLKKTVIRRRLKISKQQLLLQKQRHCKRPKMRKPQHWLQNQVL